jgi:hypothetical protein
MGAASIRDCGRPGRACYRAPHAAEVGAGILGHDETTDGCRTGDVSHQDAGINPQDRSRYAVARDLLYIHPLTSVSNA